MKALILAGLTLAAATAYTQTLNPRSIPVDGAAGPDEIPFSVIQFGSSTTYPQGGAFVLSTAPEWRGFLRQIGDTGRHEYIDWRTEQLIVVQLAASDAAGLGFRVARLRRHNGGVDVEIAINKPYGTGVNRPQPRTLRNQISPYEVLVTKRFDMPLQTVVVNE